ncbi:MAG: hypothetical protein P8175_01580 [Deltaproteobacteria bacterium]|jgi:hypothetical protein
MNLIALPPFSLKEQEDSQLLAAGATSLIEQETSAPVLIKAWAMTKFKIQNIWHRGLGFDLLAPLNVYPVKSRRAISLGAKPIQLGAFELRALAFDR